MIAGRHPALVPASRILTEVFNDGVQSSCTSTIIAAASAMEAAVLQLFSWFWKRRASSEPSWSRLIDRF